MVVTYVMVAVCVIGVIGGVVSALGYDNPSGQIGTPMRIQNRARRRVRPSRPSRQLQALEAALQKDGEPDHPTSRSAVPPRIRRGHT